MNRMLPIPLLATLVACGPSISTSGDKSLLPGAATYTWGAPLAPPAGQPEPAEASVRLRGRIQEAMEQALASKGYRKVDEASAAFLARFSVGVKTETTDVQVAPPSNEPVPMTRCDAGGCWKGYDWGYGSGNDPRFAEQTSRQAGVILELVDKASGKLAWQGRFVDQATGMSPTDERIQKAMSELIKSLPPAR